MNLEDFILYVQPEEWMERASCQDSDPSLFFPDRGTVTMTARQLCAACPVGKECLEYADRTRSTYGMWGGEYRSPRAKGNAA